VEVPYRTSENIDFSVVIYGQINGLKVSGVRPNIGAGFSLPDIRPDRCHIRAFFVSVIFSFFISHRLPSCGLFATLKSRSMTKRYT
jgi:hypothetical protein